MGGLAAWEQAGYPVIGESAVGPMLTPRPSATATPDVGTLVSSDDMPRITVQELKAKLDAGEAVVYDVRLHEAFAQRHIDGAISLPLDGVATRLAELPTDKLAAFYCT